MDGVESEEVGVDGAESEEVGVDGVESEVGVESEEVMWCIWGSGSEM